MTVLMYINLQHQPTSVEAVDVIANQIIKEYNFLYKLKPRLIYLPAIGLGSAVCDRLVAAGLPASVITDSDWAQIAFYLDDGPAHDGETNL
jgi:hypothetical protein